MSPIPSQVSKLVIFLRSVHPFSDLIIAVEANRFLSFPLNYNLLLSGFPSVQDLCIHQDPRKPNQNGAGTGLECKVLWRIPEGFQAQKVWISISLPGSINSNYDFFH